MASFPDTYETIYFTNEDYIGIYWMGRIHFFEHPVIEVVHDKVQDRYYLLCVDMVPNRRGDFPARCFPLVRVADDFRALLGIEAPEELKELA